MPPAIVITLVYMPQYAKHLFVCMIFLVLRQNIYIDSKTESPAHLVYLCIAEFLCDTFCQVAIHHIYQQGSKQGQHIISIVSTQNTQLGLSQNSNALFIKRYKIIINWVFFILLLTKFTKFAKPITLCVEGSFLILGPYLPQNPINCDGINLLIDQLCGMSGVIYVSITLLLTELGTQQEIHITFLN